LSRDLPGTGSNPDNAFCLMHRIIQFAATASPIAGQATLLQVRADTHNPGRTQIPCRSNRRLRRSRRRWVSDIHVG